MKFSDALVMFLNRLTHLFQNSCHFSASLETEQRHREGHIRPAPVRLKVIGKLLLKLGVDLVDEGLALFYLLGIRNQMVIELRDVGRVLGRNEQHHVESAPAVMLQRWRRATIKKVRMLPSKVLSNG